MPTTAFTPKATTSTQPHNTAPSCPSMPSSSRDDDTPRRRRKHDRDRDPNRDPNRDRERDHESTSSRDKHHRPSHHKTASSSKIHLSKRKSGSRERDHDRDRDSRKASTSEKAPERHSAKRKGSVAVPEMDRRLPSDMRSSTSYPSFSKAHSREAVGSRGEKGSTKAAPTTPDSTELENDGAKRSTASLAKPPPAPSRAPPSPPLTADESSANRLAGSEGVEGAGAKVNTKRQSADLSRGNGVKTARSGSSLRREVPVGESEISSMAGTLAEKEARSRSNSSYRRTESTTSHTATQSTFTWTEDTSDSDSTSIATERKPSSRPPNAVSANESSPPSVTDSQPRTPTQEFVQFTPHVPITPVIDVGMATKAVPHPIHATTAARQLPPPPPPISGPREVPRVDYLLKNGGLSHAVPKRLVQPGPVAPVQQYSVYQSPALTQSAPLEEYAKMFSSVHKRLDDYLQVLRNNGSIAVATGYKSVARRLLDKLSQVFARDISSQRCDCVVCRTTPQPMLSDEEENGVSWGEILEFVAGRRELPQWPPFSIQPDDSGLGISGATTQAPMQKLDIDVPEEYRDHYIRQNQKTKRAVQSWLALQPDFPSSPPEEADEDTLMFAMMTKLGVHQRNLFIALMHGQSFVSEARAPTPAERPSTLSNALRRAKTALQRLYRLECVPRDCEAAMYLLNNPHLHGMLATLAEVNEAEWDILISGRFDGFLWSGAEPAFSPSISAVASPVGSRVPSRGLTNTPFLRKGPSFGGSNMMPSRSTTPFSCGGDQMPSSMFPARGPTPGPNGIGVAPPAPVQVDEDTEIAVAAELERNLFLDMERLEDAFELLHGRAELVRQLLRERSAGLSAQAQLRRGHGFGDPVTVRLDTPTSGVTNFEEEEDDGLGDLVSIAPDDSASQISVNRHRRKHRKTPVPETLVEENESVFEEQQERYRKERYGRRSKY